MTLGLMRDLVDTVGVVASSGKSTATAGGSGNATAVHGPAIDVTALLTPGGSAETPAIETSNCRYESVAFILACTAALSNTFGIGVTASIETCASSGFSSGVVTLVSTETVISYTAGSSATFALVGKIGVSLENALQYIRCTFTPTLTNSGTDTSDMQTVAVFGGPAELP